MRKLNLFCLIIFLISTQFDVLSFNRDSSINPQRYSNGKWGYVNGHGKYVISPKFEEAGDFIDGLARIRIHSKYGFINESGKPKIRPQFDNAKDFSEGMAAVMVYDSDNQAVWGYIDINGHIVIKPRYDDASDFCDGKALVMDDNNKFYIDRCGGFLNQY